MQKRDLYFVRSYRTLAVENDSHRWFSRTSLPRDREEKLMSVLASNPVATILLIVLAALFLRQIWKLIRTVVTVGLLVGTAIGVTFTVLASGL